MVWRGEGGAEAVARVVVVRVGGRGGAAEGDVLVDADVRVAGG
jgi:hypothetical protein